MNSPESFNAVPIELVPIPEDHEAIETGLVEALEKKKAPLAGRAFRDFSSKKSRFGSEMTQKFGKDMVFRCRLYHVMSGSTIEEGRTDAFDLPGGLIEDFIRNDLLADAVPALAS